MAEERQVDVHPALKDVRSDKKEIFERSPGLRGRVPQTFLGLFEGVMIYAQGMQNAGFVQRWSDWAKQPQELQARISELELKVMELEG